MNLLDKIKKAVLEGDEEAAVKLVGEGVASKLEPRKIMEEGMAPAMQEIGERFARNEAFIPELIVASHAMNAGMGALKAHMKGEIKNRGLVVLGTVEGDIHSIGKNLVRMCLEGAGFEVDDIGESVKAQKFVEVYKAKKPMVLGLSALLSSTMQTMKDIVAAVRAVDPKACIIVGGAPVTKEFADQIGASGYAPNAFETVHLVTELVK
jgi:methanogenic corrinoid protein MtbC1